MLRTSVTVCWMGAVCGLTLGMPQAALGQCEATEASKCSPSDGPSGTEFGCSVSIDGGRSLIGMRQDDDVLDQSGAAYVYDFDGANWIEQRKLKALDPHQNAYFGHSVALQGDVALVGAPQDNNPLPFGGAAYVFRNDGTDWAQEQKLVASDNAALYFFGWSVAIDGNLAVIGAYNAGGTGAAYVFRFDGTQWNQEAKLTASDAATDDRFGTSVAVSGDVILIGAHHDDNTNGLDAGSVYVFSWVGGIEPWSEDDKLVANDGVSGDMFGSAVSVRDSVALVAANNDDTGWDVGSAYVFRHNGASWVEEYKLAAAPETSIDSEFAYSVAINGDVAVVGAIRDDGGAATTGTAYVYAFDGGIWSEQATLMSSDGDLEDRFGASVSMSGNRILIGARADDPAGSAYVFDGLNDGVPDSCAAACPGNADGDSEVGIGDFLMVLGAWGPNPGHPADFDGDDEVGIGDFLIVLGNWGPC